VSTPNAQSRSFHSPVAKTNEPEGNPMGKQTVLIQLSLLLLVGLLSVTADLCLAVEEELYRAKENICFLIDSGQYAQAESAIDKLAIEFTGDADLPWAFY